MYTMKYAEEDWTLVIPYACALHSSWSLCDIFGPSCHDSCPNTTTVDFWHWIYMSCKCSFAFCLASSLVFGLLIVAFKPLALHVESQSSWPLVIVIPVVFRHHVEGNPGRTPDFGQDEGLHVVWVLALVVVAFGNTDIATTQLVVEHLSGVLFRSFAGVRVVQVGLVTACDVSESHNCGELYEMCSLGKTRLLVSCCVDERRLCFEEHSTSLYDYIDTKSPTSLIMLTTTIQATLHAVVINVVGFTIWFFVKDDNEVGVVDRW